MATEAAASGREEPPTPLTPTSKPVGVGISPSTVSILNNGGFGVSCAPPPYVPQIQGGISSFIISGNASGSTNCPVFP